MFRRICLCLSIFHIYPLEYKLQLERFLVENQSIHVSLVGLVNTIADRYNDLPFRKSTYEASVVGISIWRT
jgi:hypothetical protein